MASKIAKILRCKRGISLLEAIFSILLLTVLLATVSSLMMTASRLTHRGWTDSQAMQANANAALIRQGLSPAAGTVTFTLVTDAGGGVPGLTVGVPVDVYTAGGGDDGGVAFISFDPQPQTQPQTQP
ncbi:MAG: hypothetical protein FWD98_00950 [Defluviitaleaceae bacterium]|nr:hypothetical protein [Defluviitaleaceae bacterium]